MGYDGQQLENDPKQHKILKTQDTAESRKRVKKSGTGRNSSFKTQIPVAKTSKTCPPNDLQIPANIPVKEHLR